MYIINLFVTYFNINLIEYLEKIFKKNKIKCNIEYSIFENNPRKNLESVIIKIETKNNIIKFLKNKLEKVNFIEYPKEIIFYFKRNNMKSKKYFIKSKLKDNSNYFYLYVEYSTKVDVNLLI